MCGIAGFIGYKKIEQKDIEATLYQMKNRGPDANGTFEFNYENIFGCLLHSRLSILDLNERSNQPFTLGHCTVVFNGEIYNYVELKKNLIAKTNIEFQTTSDTEVLLRYYMEYGTECTKYFEGMWSFAIWDDHKKHLFLSRDRFAEKPLYLYKSKEGLYFGSEIKFLKALSNQSFTINYQHVLRYFINGYRSLYQTDEGFFNEVQELGYANNLVVNLDLQETKSSYWQVNCQRQEMSLAEAIEGTREHFLQALNIRLRSDVPMAFCLSGGIDSSSIVSTAAKVFNYDVTTFSIIDSDERYNEYDNIKATIDDTQSKHFLLSINTTNTIEKLRNLIDYHDSPISTITFYVHSLLSEEMAKNGYKVAFCGTGADELFPGYYDHYLMHLRDIQHHPNFATYLSDWEKYVKKYVRNPLLRDPYQFINNENMREHLFFRNEEFSKYLKRDFHETTDEKDFNCKYLLHRRMLNEMFHEVTRTALHEDDLNSMKYSIENRSPYLDSKLFSFAYSIPIEYGIMHGYNKYVLREAMKGILNDQVRLSREKKGFNAAITSLVDFKDENVTSLLLDPNAKVFDLIHRDKMKSLFELDFIPNSSAKFLFNFINLRFFLENN